MASTMTSARWTALALGVPLVLASTLWSTLTLASLAAHASETTAEVYDVATPRVTVVSGDGDISLAPSADGRVHVTTITHFGLQKPLVEARVDDAGLTISSTCAWWTNNCEVDLRIELPASYDVKVSTAGGGISARGLAGAAELSSSAGNVRVSDMAGVLRLSSSAGNVEGTAVRSPSVVARSSAGDVEVLFASAPDDVTAHSSAGDVVIAVPPGDAYRVVARTSAGSEDVTVAQDPAARRAITASSSAGDVEVLASGG